MGNYPPAYLYRKISQVTSFVGALRSGDTLPPSAECPPTPVEALRTRPADPAGLLCAPTPPSIGEDAQSPHKEVVQDVVEEAIQTVEEVTHVVEEVSGDASVPTPLSIGEVANSHNTNGEGCGDACVSTEVTQVVEEATHVVEEVKEVIEEVKEVVEEVVDVVEEVAQVVEEVAQVVEEVQEVVEEVTHVTEVQEEIKEDIEKVQEIQEVQVQIQDAIMEEAPQVVHESFMPAFHFPISPFSMSPVQTQPNRLRYRKRRG